MGRSLNFTAQETDCSRKIFASPVDDRVCFQQVNECPSWTGSQPLGHGRLSLNDFHMALYQPISLLCGDGASLPPRVKNGILDQGIFAGAKVFPAHGAIQRFAPIIAMRFNIFKDVLSSIFTQMSNFLRSLPGSNAFMRICGAVEHSYYFCRSHNHNPK